MSEQGYANDAEHIVHLTKRIRDAEAMAETWRKMAGDAVAKEKKLSSVAHDIIFAIRCELEQPSPSMEKIREHLNQWEMRR